MVEPHTNGSRLPSWVVAVGASAGGLGAITELVRQLPANLDAAVLVVLHLLPTSHSALPSILARNTELTVSAASDMARIERGNVYVAPPDRHLQVDRHRVRVVRGPWENGHRPAVDALFRSVARWWGPRGVAVVLSGALDDGAAGAIAVERRGGTVFVQDPHEAPVPNMPLAVLQAGVTTERLRVEEIAARLVTHCKTAADADANGRG
jgi:two-component system chemotaxis response regulator CheB